MNDKIKTVCLIYTIIFFGSISLCLAQTDSRNLFLKEGIIIREANIAVSGEEFSIRGYRLEQIKLEKPIVRNRNQAPLTDVFRIVIVANTSLPQGLYSIWLGNNQIDAYQVKANEVATIVYSQTLPNNYIRLAISKRNEKNLTSRLTVPETINIPEQYATPLEEIEAKKPNIKLYKTSRGNNVELQIEFPGMSCVSGQKLPVIEIDDFQQSTFCTGTILTVLLTSEQFSRLRNGADIALKKDFSDDNSRDVIGRLDKNIVQ